MAKIFAHGSTAATPPTDGSTPSPVTAPSPGVSPSATPGTAGAAPVDITAVMDDLAGKSSEDLDWKSSIVDMLKLVGMDSSLTARKELADDLHYTGDKGDSATMNEWLHKEVLNKLAANGGKVPAELLG